MAQVRASGALSSAQPKKRRKRGDDDATVAMMSVKPWSKLRKRHTLPVSVNFPGLDWAMSQEPKGGYGPNGG